MLSAIIFGYILILHKICEIQKVLTGISQLLLILFVINHKRSVIKMYIHPSDNDRRGVILNNVIDLNTLRISSGITREPVLLINEFLVQ